MLEVTDLAIEASPEMLHLIAEFFTDKRVSGFQPMNEFGMSTAN